MRFPLNTQNIPVIRNNETHFKRIFTFKKYHFYPAKFKFTVIHYSCSNFSLKTKQSFNWNLHSNSSSNSKSSYNIVSYSPALDLLSLDCDEIEKQQAETDITKGNGQNKLAWTPHAAQPTWTTADSKKTQTFLTFFIEKYTVNKFIIT